ncbi:MAG: type IV toxin-antitoxin system AbiEi family antitoxin [Candidatus Acidiferrales bacterium]
MRSIRGHQIEAKATLHIVSHTYISCSADCSVGNVLGMEYKLRYIPSIVLCFTGYPLRTHYNPNLRTSRSQTARLLMALYDSGQTTFTIGDAVRITGLQPPLASSLLHKAAKRGIVSRLKRGLFAIVPAELGSSVEYSGNPYLVARYLVGSAPYYLSHASAMELHRMVTQPQFIVFVSSTKRIPNQTLHGTRFRFVLLKPKNFFGTMKHWVTKQEWVEISDLERTIIDGLRQPEYCGGITDLAEGLWMRHADMNVQKLLEYATRLNIGSVKRRLGYLLELFGLASEEQLQAFRKSLTATYVPLDPLLPREGPHLAKWRVQINTPPEELQAARTS